MNLRVSADFFVDPCAPRRLVLSVPLCCTPKTSSRALPSLRMTRWDNVHGKRSAPYKFVRRARSFGRVAPSRMTARTGARSAPIRELAVFYSSAVAINQSKRLCTKGHLAEGSFRGGSSAAGGEGVPFPKAKLIFLLTKSQVIRKYIFELKG